MNLLLLALFIVFIALPLAILFGILTWKLLGYVERRFGILPCILLSLILMVAAVYGLLATNGVAS